MGTLFDITGNIFGRLTVLHLGEISTSKGDIAGRGPFSIIVKGGANAEAAA